MLFHIAINFNSSEELKDCEKFIATGNKVKAKNGLSLLYETSTSDAQKFADEIEMLFNYDIDTISISRAQ